MSLIPIISDAFGRSEDIARPLADLFETRLCRPDEIAQLEHGPFAIIDINLKDSTHLPALRDWLNRGPKSRKSLFVANKSSRLETVRAFAAGATDLIHRPIDIKTLLAKLWGDFRALTVDQTDFAGETSAGVTAAYTALQNVFCSACLGEPLDPKKIDVASSEVVHQIEDQGLAGWIESVRKHHSQTYQHCLLVTGVAVTFGQQLGFAARDRQRLAFAGMLHDIGKARVPVAILEKPYPLDPEEEAILRMHPQYGLDALRTVPDVDPEMADMVIHHHEYLDGSGYPHQLSGNEISDFVRIITIADIFGALIERRAYRGPLTSEAAYQYLIDMDAKLDKDLVREFSFMSRIKLKAA